MKHFSKTLLFAVLTSFLSAGICLGEPGKKNSENKIVNGGFEKNASDAFADWQHYSNGEGVAIDEAAKHSGDRSLRITTGGALMSKPVPYRGGRVRVSGWIKTDKVVAGERPWFKAAIQLIPLDSQHKPVGHVDVALLDGTHGWARYERTTVLSREVSHVAVFCRFWGPDVRGTAWFDDISLEMLDDPSQFAAGKPDLDKATLTVSFGKEQGELLHLWIGSDVCHMDRITSSTQINAMRYARQFGFRYIRMHNCVHDANIYSEDAAGRPVYRWETFDERIGAVVDNGMRPVIVFEGMPPEIATVNEGKSWKNAYPPKGPEGYRKWREICRQIVAHCKEKWGDDIHDWYFEVWNEPDAKGYFNGTQEEYFKIYDYAIAGATSADPKIRIGGTGGADHKWVRDFLSHCRDGRNAATGRIGCRTDYLSWHIYTFGEGFPAFDKLRMSLSEVRETLGDYPEYRDLPTLITEWGCSSCRFAMHDRPYDAAFRTMAVREFMDHGITLALPFAFGDGPPHADEGFRGSLSMLTKTTIPKPSFRAFELLDRMRGTRVECRGSCEPVGGLACISPDRSRAWITLYNLIENYNHRPYNTSVTVKLDDLPEGVWSCEQTSIVPGECDPALLWKKMNSPATLTKEQREELLKASELPEPKPVRLADGEIHFDMPGFSVVQLELRRTPTPKDD